MRRNQRAPEVRVALDRIAAGMSRAGSGALAFDAGLRQLQAQQAAAAALAERLATANERMVAGLSQAGREAEVASAGARAWERGIANLRAQNEAASQGFDVAGRSTRDLARSLGTLAISAVGAQGPVSRVALSFLPFLGVSLGVVAAGAAIAVAYDRMTASARKLREEQDKLVDALRQRLQQPVPAGLGGTLTPGQTDPDLQRQIAAAEAQRAQAAARLATAEAAVRGELESQRALLGSYGTAQGIAAVGAENLLGIERQRVEVARQQQAVSAATQLLDRLRAQAATEAAARQVQQLQQAVQTQTAFAASLAAAAEAGLRIPEQGRQMAAHLSEQLALSRDITASNSQRVAALQAVNALLLAQTAPIRAQLDLIRETGAAELARLQRLAQTPIDVTRTIPIAVDVGGADLGALGQQIDEQVSRLDAFRAQFDQTTDAAKALAEQARGLQTLGESIDEAIRAADAAPLQLLGDAAGELGQRLELLRGQALPGVRAESAATAETTRRLVQVCADLTTEIDRQGGALGASTLALQAAAQAQQGLSPGTVPFVQGLGLAIERLQQAEAALAAFRSEVGEAFVPIRIGFEVEVDAARRAVEQFFADLQRRQRERSTVKLDLLPAPEVQGISGAFDQASQGADA